MYDPLYVFGGELGGFRCRDESCQHRVTRTQRGMLVHQLRVHGRKMQIELFDVRGKIIEKELVKN